MCATISSSVTPQRLEKFIVHQFFDQDLTKAIEKREKTYIRRMTDAFRGELKRQLHDTATQLTESQKQLAQKDKQMDFMRSQLDRRRLELETQRRKFIHEIIGLRKKETTSGFQSNAALTEILKHAFKDDRKDDSHLLISTRRSGMDEGMGETHLTSGSSEAKFKAMMKMNAKLKERNTSLQEQLAAQQEMTDSCLEKSRHWEKIASDLSKGEASRDQASKRMKLGMKFASGARLAQARKKQMWWHGSGEARQMVEKLTTNTFGSETMTPVMDTQLFESLLCFYGANDILDFFLPRYHAMVEKQKIIAHEKKRGVVTRITTEEDDDRVRWMHNIHETAAMLLCQNKLVRGELGLGEDMQEGNQENQEGNQENQEGNQETQENQDTDTPTPPVAANVLFCHVMDNSSTDVICPWCEGRGSVVQERQVVSADIESEQLAERLRTQLGRVKTALHMAGNKIKALQKKPRRRHVNVQVDEQSIDMECGGADAEHHKEEEEAHLQETELLMEQASQAIQAMSELKVVRKECKELQKKLASKEVVLLKRKEEILRLKKDHEATQLELTSLMGQDLHAASNADQAEHVNRLKNKVAVLEEKLRIDEDHLSHAGAVGKRLKQADIELQQLKGELLLKNVEIGALKRDIEEALKLAAMSSPSTNNGTTNVSSSQARDNTSSGTQTDLDVDWAAVHAVAATGGDGGGIGNTHDNTDKDTEQERTKTWRWLTETHQDMKMEDPFANQQGPETDEENGPVTVRDALEARKWLVSKQAIMNWGVLTQTLLNIMEVGNQEQMYHQQQR